MAKTQEELTQLKQEYETLIIKLKELAEDELNLVTGGVKSPNHDHELNEIFMHEETNSIRYVKILDYVDDQTKPHNYWASVYYVANNMCIAYNLHTTCDDSELVGYTKVDSLPNCCEGMR